MNGWMSNTKDVLLCYTECKTIWNVCLCITNDLLSCLLKLNYYGTFVRVSRRVYYYVTMNVKLL